MSFDLYFAGSQSKQASILLKQLGCNKLCSQFTEGSLIKSWVDYKKDNPDSKCKIFVDSGAWTAYTKGITIDIDDYISFINEIGDWVEIFAELDKLPGALGKTTTYEDIQIAAEESWNNYLYMINNVDPKFQHKIMPVFHHEEEFYFLERMLDYVFPDGSKIEYIGLGAVADIKNKQRRRKWFDKCFELIRSSNNPDVKVHAFGMTSIDLLNCIPFYSADSTSWIMNCINGNIWLEGKSIYIGEDMSGNNSFYDITDNILSLVVSRAKEYNLSLDQLRSDYISRSLFNIHEFKRWQDSYVYEGNKNFKQIDLW